MAHFANSLDLISFPFRVGPNGNVVTRPDDSSDYYAELIAQLILTKPGERDQVPLFGLGDPTFDEFDAQELISKIDLFGPPITIAGVRSQFVDEKTQKIVVEFLPLESNAADIITTT